MFPFKYDRYSKNPIKGSICGVNIEYLKQKDDSNTVLSIDKLFNNYIQQLEQQRGFKYSRKDKRELYRKFIKSYKK